MVVGIVFVFSASFPNASRPDAMMLPGNPYYFLVRHSIFVGIALVAMLLTSIVPPAWMRRAALVAFLITVVLMLMALYSPWGVSHDGARRWLRIPSLPEFQPSELAKFTMILLLAGVLAHRDEEDDESGSAYGIVLVVTAVMGALLLLQRDQGMATIFALISLSMLLFAGMRLHTLLPLAVGGLATGLVFAYQVPYRWRRIMAFIDLENALPRDRYHIVNMLRAIARGGGTGTGLGMSPDKWGALPAPHTDSIFSVIGCEVGLLGALVILALVILMTYRGFHIARNSGSAFGFYVVTGVCAMLCLQSLAHIAVNTACMPCTGLTLPFISGGGTSLLSASVAAGAVLAVSRYEVGDEA
jgi:cell division protein FtsW